LNPILFPSRFAIIAFAVPQRPQFSPRAEIAAAKPSGCNENDPEIFLVSVRLRDAEAPPDCQGVGMC
jgi:hypothetical protein